MLFETHFITKNCSCNIQIIFSEAKNENFIGKILIFQILLLKTLWVHVRTTHAYPQSMFWIKNKKIRYTLANPSFSI